MYIHIHIHIYIYIYIYIVFILEEGACPETLGCEYNKEYFEFTKFSL